MENGHTDVHNFPIDDTEKRRSNSRYGRMHGCQKEKKKRKKKEANDEVGNPTSFLQPVILSPFGVSHSRGNAVKSFVRMRNEAEEEAFSLLSIFLSFFPLSPVKS